MTLCPTSAGGVVGGTGVSLSGADVAGWHHTRRAIHHLIPIPVARHLSGTIRAGKIGQA